MTIFQTQLYSGLTNSLQNMKYGEQWSLHKLAQSQMKNAKQFKSTKFC